MPITPFHVILLPLLCRSADGKEWTLAALRVPTPLTLASPTPSGRRYTPAPCRLDS